ncbi:EamA family transporter [Streptosporangium canum]|uniref:EamA family transporter n=1 Tax=Streptosporangium canum TaxID=324952 RepID=UPI0036B27F1B
MITLPFGTVCCTGWLFDWPRAVVLTYIVVVSLYFWGRCRDRSGAGSGCSAAAGALDSVANLLFLLAARSGDLSVVAVITALYPAGTVLLARSVLHERIGRGQLVGLGAAAGSLLALS